MTDQELEKVVNARLEKLFDLYPIENLQPSQVTEDMKDGLSKVYSHRGFRAYLENAIKIAVKNMAMAPKDEIIYYKSRVDVLEQLLAKGKQMFETTNPTKRK